MGEYLVQVQFDYNKLWSGDTGRNLAGTQSGTLIGVFPKLILQFRPLTKEELHIISQILDKANQNVTYYDPNKNKNITMKTYSGDWGVLNRNINRNDGFSCSLISVKKRA